MTYILNNFVYGTASENDARLRRYTRNPADNGFGLVRFWSFTDARSARAFVNELNSTASFTDPKADGVTYSGTFYGEATIADGQDDRSIVVEQTISQSKLFDEATSWAENCKGDVYMYVKEGLTETQLATEIAEWQSSSQGSRFEVSPRFDSKSGRWKLNILEHVGRSHIQPEFTDTASARFSETRQIVENQTSPTVDMTRAQGEVLSLSIRTNDKCLYDYERSKRTSTADEIYFASELTRFRRGDTILYDNSRDLIEPPATVSGSGIYRVEQSKNDDGTYSGRMIYEQGTDTGEALFRSQQATTEEEQSVLYKSRNSAIAAPATDVQGHVYRAENRLGDDGLYDATLIYATSKPLGVYSLTERTAFSRTDTILYENSRANIETPATVTSGIYRAQQSVNRDGTYTGSLVYRRGTNTGSAGFGSERTVLGQDRTTIYRARNIPIQAEAALQSGIYRADNSLNDDGTYDGRLVYQGSIAKTVENNQQRTPFSLRSGLLYENSRSVITVPDSVESGVYTAQQSMNRDGTYSGGLTYETGTNSGEAEFGSERAVLRSEDTVLYRKRTDAIDALAATVGGVYSASNRLGDDGLYDADLVYRLSAEKTTLVGMEDSAMVERSGILYNSSRSLIPLPTSTAGRVYELDQALNVDGTYDGKLSATTSVEDSVRFVSSKTAFRNGTSLVYANHRGAIDAPDATMTDGGVYRVDQRFNRDGTYDGALVYEVGTNAGQAGFASARRLLGNENSVVYRSRTTQVGAESALQGAMYQAENTLGDDGLYDSRLVYSESLAARMGLVTQESAMRREMGIVYANQRSLMALPENSGSGIYRLTASFNRDGSYDGNLTYSYGKDSGEARFEASHTSLSDQVALIYRSRNTQVDAPQDVLGAVYAASNELGDDGLYDSRLVYEESAEKTISSVIASTPTTQTDALLYRNSRTDLSGSLPSNDTGTYRMDGLSLNRDGTYDGALIYTHQKGDGSTIAFASLKSAVENDTTYVYNDRSAKAEAGADGVGYIYQVTNSLNNLGLYDSSVTAKVSEEIARNIARSRTHDSDVDEYVYQASRSEIGQPATPGQGGVYTVTSSLNADGTYDGSMVYQASKARSLAIGYKTENMQVYVYTLANQTDVAVPAGVSVYWDNSLSGVRMNPDGTYDYNVISRQRITGNDGTGATLWANATDGVYLMAEDTGRYYQLANCWTRHISTVHDWLNGAGAGVYGSTPSGAVTVGRYDGHKTDFRMMGTGRFIATRVDLYD